MRTFHTFYLPWCGRLAIWEVASDGCYHHISERPSTRMTRSEVAAMLLLIRSSLRGRENQWDCPILRRYRLED